jgi:P4 family phage/plasmid primase-like protien
MVYTKERAVQVNDDMRDFSLTNRGLEWIKEGYHTLAKLCPVVRPNLLYVTSKNKKHYAKCEPIKNEDGSYKKFKSCIAGQYFGKYYQPNVYQVFTGTLHGGLIGIDVDVKDPGNEHSVQRWEDEMGSHIKECNKDVSKKDPRYEEEDPFNTLSCSTPSGGKHYVYFLTKEQQEMLDSVAPTFNPKVNMDHFPEVDIVYNLGRFNMIGAIRSYDGEEELTYEITNDAKPRQIPQYIFNQIYTAVRRQSSSKISSDKKPSKSPEDKKPSKKKELEYESDSDSDEDEGYPHEKELFELLSYLPSSYVSDYDKWFRYSCIFFNSVKDYKLYCKWCKQCPSKYDEKACRKLWKSLEKNNDKKLLTLKTLFFDLENIHKGDSNILAKINKLKIVFFGDPNSPFNFISNLISENTQDKTDKKGDICGYKFRGFSDKDFYDIFRICSNKQIVYDPKTNKWYQLNKFNIWEIEEQINKVISNSLQSIFSSYNKQVYERNNKEIILKWCSAKNEIEKKINNNSSLVHIYKYFQAHFTECISPKLNCSSPYVFPFDNGVYDFQENCFRLPRPDEYISKTCGYDYREPDDAIRKAANYIFKTLKETQYNKECFEWLLKCFAQCLVAEGHREQFYCFTGQGGNGKSLFFDFINNTFGWFAKDIDSCYFQKTKMGRNPNSADSRLMSMQGRRVIIPTEIAANAVTETALLKQISGGGKIEGRALYQESTEFVPTFMFFFQTNNSLTLDETSGDAIRRRLIMIRFPFSFVKNPTLPDQKKMDITLKTKIKNDTEGLFKIAFFHILRKYYYLLQEDAKSFDELPKEIQSDTDMFHFENNPVAGFVEVKIEKTGNPADKIKCCDLFTIFNNFNQSSVKVNMTKFYCDMEKAGFIKSKLKGYNYYRGIKVKPDSDPDPFGDLPMDDDDN